MFENLHGKKVLERITPSSMGPPEAPAGDGGDVQRGDGQSGDGDGDGGGGGDADGRRGSVGKR